jgi:hypothetical protein
MQMFERGQAATQPFREAGIRGMQGMESLMSPEGQAEFMQSYQQSPMFQQMMDQGSENILKQASATGGLRTGQSNVAMGSLAPQLMMNALSNQFGQYQSLAQPGAQMASQTAGLAPQVGQSIGGYQAAGTSGMANIAGQAVGELGGYLENQLPFGKGGYL